MGIVADSPRITCAKIIQGDLNPQGFQSHQSAERQFLILDYGAFGQLYLQVFSLKTRLLQDID
ncbi:MAG: hypothetical protein EBE86_032785 [Hormoscilla sp. GUM202]|nr:hypothetical protein [Hormoscilla sp. GUM202]